MGCPALIPGVWRAKQFAGDRRGLRQALQNGAVAVALGTARRRCFASLNMTRQAQRPTANTTRCSQLFAGNFRRKKSRGKTSAWRFGGGEKSTTLEPRVTKQLRDFPFEIR